MKKFILLFISLSLIILSGCATKPWIKFPINKEPDKSCWSGDEGGYEIYLWDCFKNEHIVIYQWQSGLYKLPSKLEKSSCGVQTNFEKKYKIEMYPNGVCKKNATPWIVTN